MRVERRRVLIGLAALGGAATGWMVAPGQPAAAAQATYLANRAPLQPAAFLRLPPGAVRPRLARHATRLPTQRLCGRDPEISHFLRYDNTGWINSDLGGGGGTMRVQNKHSGKVLAVHNISLADSANVEQYQDNGTADHV